MVAFIFMNGGAVEDHGGGIRLNVILRQRHEVESVGLSGEGVGLQTLVFTVEQRSR